MKRTAPGPIVLLLVLTACAAQSGGSVSPPGSSPPSSGPPAASAEPSTGASEDGAIEHPTGDEPILVVSSEGGFVMVDMLAVQIPSFVLLGDGRVIVQGVQTLEFPGPALPVLQERTLTEEGIQMVLAALQGTNLFVGNDIELRGMENMVADASDTVFTLNAAGLESRVSIYGLGAWSPDMGMEPPPGVDQGELQAHELLMSLNDQLLTLETTLPGEAWETEGWQPYEPEAFRLFVRDMTGQPVEGGDLPEQVRDWPTDDDPAGVGEEAANFGDGTRCWVVEGELATTWFEELTQANQMTLWTTDGEDRWSVRPRPLLPHEDRSCPPLDGGA